MKVTKKCAFCGQSFETRSGMQRYCSEACQAESKRTRAMQKNNLFKLAQPLMEIQHQEYLTFSKAAILMGCSRQYIYKLVAIGKLNASRISNRMAFIRRADIEQMLASNPYHRTLPLHRESPLRLPHPSKRKRGKRKTMKCWTSIRVKRLWPFIRSSNRGFIPLPNATRYPFAVSLERTITARNTLMSSSVLPLTSAKSPNG